MHGLIKKAVQTPIFGNVFFLAMLGLGILALANLKRETFPNFSLDRVQVVVKQEGASPSDIEESICVKVEEGIQGIEGIKKIESTAREGVGLVVAEVDPKVSSVDEVLDDVKDEVDRLEFPDDADEPIVTEVKRVNLVLQIAISGDVEPRTLKELAEEVRNDLLDLPEVSQVKIVGAKPYQISIEVSEQSLRQVGLRMEDVVTSIRRESVDIPAGGLKTTGGEILLRTEGKRRTGKEFEDLVVLARPDGVQITLSEIATIRDAFEETDESARFNGDPAVFVLVFKTDEEDMVDIAEAVRAYAKGKSLPEGVDLEVYSVVADEVTARLGLLLENGIQGMVMVFLVLWFFLGLRLAFWVSLGVPLSYFGTLFVLWMSGHTLNMSSMFAFIMCVGMNTDDAIVISENIYVQYRAGKPPLRAAIEGAAEVALGVCTSALTVGIAFLPLFFVDGPLGKLMPTIPLIVIASLVVGIFECFFSMTAHLGHGLPVVQKPGRLDWIRRGIDGGVDWVTNRLYAPLLRLALRFKGATVAIPFALTILAVGLMAGRKVKFTVFPATDSDYVRVRFELAPGASIEQTEAVARALENAAVQMDEEWGGSLVVHTSTILGQNFDPSSEKASHLGEVNLQLLGAESRGVSSEQILDRWRELAGEIPGVERMLFAISTIRPSAKPVEVQFIGDDIVALRAAKDDFRERLRKFAGVYDVIDDDQQGKIEYKFRLKKEARSLGVATWDVASQLREGFHGEEAVNIQRGREEVEVRLRYPLEDRRKPSALDDIRIRTVVGEEVPLRNLVDVQIDRSLAVIRRVDRRRSITVSAELNPKLANAEETVQALEAEFLGKLSELHPGVTYKLEGQRKQARESIGSLAKMLGISFVAILGVLCLAFRSWAQGILMLAVVPVSLFGVIFGHWVMGFDISFMSLAGVVALAGVVINDSIALLEVYNEMLSRGTPVAEAVFKSGTLRLRSLFLTGITTVVGLFPMLTETSVQSKYLIPTAISLSFGLLYMAFATPLFFPALIGSFNEILRVIFWLRNGRMPTPEEVEPAVIRSKHEEEMEHGAEEEIELPEEMAVARPVDSEAAVAAIASRATLEGRVDAKGLSVEELIERANASSEKDDFAGALAHYDAAIRLDPCRCDVLSTMGMMRVRLQDWPGAVSNFDQALRLDPENLDLIEYRAFAQLRARNYEAALIDLTRTLKASPDNLLALKARATALVGLERYAEAVEDFTAALRHAPRNADIHFLRGDALRKKGDARLAVADFDHAIERQPDNAKAFLYRGTCKATIGQREEAISDLTRAFDLDPGLHEAIYHRARIHIDLGDGVKAEEDLSWLLARQPDQADLHLLRGKARAAVGDSTGAIADYRIYLERTPRSKLRRALETYIRDQQIAARRQ